MVGIKGVELVEWKRFEDERGYFAETFKHSTFDLPRYVVQRNESLSHRGVVRGLHYQFEPPMGKLMRVTRGAAYLIALDIRSSSETYGEHVGITLTEQDLCAVWAPAEFARGFQALEEDTVVDYLCTNEYNASGEGAVRWDSVDIAWPLKPTIISHKDRTAQTFDEYRKQSRF